MMQKDLVFIASGGRTGTQFFGERLSTVIPDCWSEHEPDMIHGFSRLTLQRIRRFGPRHMILDRLIGTTGVRAIGHKLLSERIHEDVAIERLRAARTRYHRSIRQSLIIESYPRWWMFAGRLHRVWPGAKTIGVIRDPRDWIESWISRRPDIHRLAWLHWFPLGPLTPRVVGDLLWADRWKDMGQFGRLAWDWRFTYSLLDRAAETAPDVRILRYEDLFGTGDEAIRSLLAFATEHRTHCYQVGDLEGFTSERLNMRPGPRQDWRNWRTADARLVEELCGPLMRKYGYGLEADWKAMIGSRGKRQS